MTTQHPAPATGSWAPLTNMNLAMQTMHRLENAADGVPRMGLFYGPSGFGKTTAAAYVAANSGAAYLLARSVWTHRAFLEALARELGITHLRATAARMMDQIIEQLEHDPRPLLIDEMDHLVTRKMVEVIRDIYEATQVPILMIGEEALPAKLKEWERFDNRILVASPAQPSDTHDGRLLRDLYCRKVAIADDLVDHFTERCRGVTRRIVTNLQEAQTVAIDELGVMTLDRAAWGRRAVAVGDLTPRRAVRLAA